MHDNQPILGPWTKGALIFLILVALGGGAYWLLNKPPLVQKQTEPLSTTTEIKITQSIEMAQPQEPPRPPAEQQETPNIPETLASIEPPRPPPDLEIETVKLPKPTVVTMPATVITQPDYITWPTPPPQIVGNVILLERWHREHKLKLETRRPIEKQEKHEQKIGERKSSN